MEHRNLARTAVRNFQFPEKGDRGEQQRFASRISKSVLFLFSPLLVESREDEHCMSFVVACGFFKPAKSSFIKESFDGRSGAALEVCIFLQERFYQIASSCSSLALEQGIVKLWLEL